MNRAMSTDRRKCLFLSVLPRLTSATVTTPPANLAFGFVATRSLQVMRRNCATPRRHRTFFKRVNGTIVDIHLVAVWLQSL